ncbi:MAG: phosphate ABC transporter permease [Thermoplasmata archaeon]|nr:MAG: phosphate ABC transporter permease [Thermoplasmata archaeon]
MSAIVKIKIKISSKRIGEKGIKCILFITAIFAVVAIFTILFFLLKEAYPIFRQEGILDFIFGRIWKPEGEIYGFPASYGALPLIMATLMVTLGAMLISVPLGIGSAIFISEIAPASMRNIVKPAIELLAGIPSVVYGFFGLVVLVSWLQRNFNVASGEGWFAASIILAIMALPTIASVAEDAINAVPREFKEGSLALGATKWQTIRNVVLPSAMSGITAAIILGMGRAIGETMAVMMVIGNSAQMPSFSKPFMPLKTLTSAIAVEMGEAPYASMWQHSLYGLAVILLVIVLVINIISTVIMERIKEKFVPSNKRKIVISCKLRQKVKKILVLFFLSLIITLLTLSLGIKTTCVLLLPIITIYVIYRYLSVKTMRILPPNLEQKIAYSLIFTAVSITIFLLFIVIYYIVANGIKALSWEFITQPPKNLGREGGIFPAIVGTLMLVGGAILFALPVGVGAAIYLNEYTKEGKMRKIIRTGTDLLNGTPSIIFGLFGLTFFVMYLGFGVSLLAGQLTLALMILPTIIRTTEEALKSVPQEIREASFALGATKWQTIKKVVLPSSLPGILTGIILSIGRAAGETAPILFTAAVFSQRFLPSSPFQPVMALPYHLFILSTSIPGEEAKINAAGTALVLVMLVLAMYAGAIVIRSKYRKKMRW